LLLLHNRLNVFILLLSYLAASITIPPCEGERRRLDLR
jgi:hypothetical protein